MMHKSFPYELKKAEEKTINGVPVGVIEGFASTYGNLDRGGDIVMPGAFSESLNRHKVSERSLRMYWQHDHNEFIGQYPIDSVKDMPEGLFVSGQINLDTRRGKEAYSLAKMGALQDFSIGYSIDDFEIENGNRLLKKLELWEVSPVSEPMNDQAQVTSVKSATGFSDLSLASFDREWDSDAAIDRVREFTNSEDAPSSKYKDAFFWYDSANPEDFGSYKLPFADVINGRLTAVPRGIFSAAAAINGARGGVEIPDGEREAVIEHINRYYTKMDRESPLKLFVANGREFKYIDASTVREMLTVRDIEELLISSGSFSKKAAATLISKINAGQSDSGSSVKSQRDVDNNSVAKQLAELKNLIDNFKD